MTSLMEGVALPDPAEVDVPEGYAPITSSSPFSGLNGPVFERVDAQDRLWRGFRVARRHVNRGGVVHGGMMMTLADIIIGQRAWTLINGPCVTVKMSCEFMAAARIDQWVEGYAEVMGHTDDLVHLHALICCEGKTLLSAHGVFKALAGRPAS